MNKRKVTIKPINSNELLIIESAATTIGELKAELKADGKGSVLDGNIRVIQKENKSTLDVDGAALLPQDITLFAFTEKNRAGADKYDAMKFKALRKECTKRSSIDGIKGNYGSADAMREALRKDDASTKVAKTEVESEDVTVADVVAEVTEIGQIVKEDLGNMKESITTNIKNKVEAALDFLSELPESTPCPEVAEVDEKAIGEKAVEEYINKLIMNSYNEIKKELKSKGKIA